MNVSKIAMLFIVVFVLFGCSLSGSSSSDSKKSAYNYGCASVGKTLKPDDRVNAEINDKSDPTKIMDKDSYSIEEIKNLAYGATYTAKGEAYYSTFELCDLGTNEYLSDGDFSKDEFSYQVNTTVEDYGVYAESASGHKTNFVSTSSDGEEVIHVVPGGKYSINVFVSEEGNEEWVWADAFEFAVE